MLVAIALSAALSGSALLADPELAAALGRIKPASGAWVEYLIRSPGEGDARVRVSAFAGGSEGGYWLELATASGSGIAGAVRLLVHGDDVWGGGIERMYVMLAGQQPLEIPLERLASALPAPRPALRVHRIGSARVRVTAGTFAAEVSRVADTTVWRGDRVAALGIGEGAIPAALRRAARLGCLQRALRVPTRVGSRERQHQRE